MACILRATDEHSGGSETNKPLNTGLAISLHEPHRLGATFQPSNSVTGQMAPIIIKDDLAGTVQEVRAKLTVVKDHKLAQNTHNINWYLSYIWAVLPTRAFQAFFDDIHFKSHFISSNMAGPKQPWFFHGGQVEYFLIGLPCLGAPMFGIATVGDNVKLTMVTDAAACADEPQLLLARIESLLTGEQLQTS